MGARILDLIGHHLTVTDVAVAVFVTVMTVVGTADSVGGATVGVEGYVLIAVGGLALLVRRRWPLTVFSVALTVMMVYFLRGHPEGLVWLPATVALANVTISYGWRRAVWLLGLCLALSGTDDLSHPRTFLSIQSLTIVLGLGCAIAVGEWLRTRREYLAVVEERAELTEAARRREAAAQLSQQRLDLAREVHDVLAHALASISVQAGVGEHLGGSDPARSQQILGSIRTASQAALDDLRATLGRLRVDHWQGPDPLPPSPGLADLDRLVGMAREAGLDVELHVRGPASGLPDDVDLAAYRIVQEAVTNALKYAGDAHVQITIRSHDGALAVTVEDDGAGVVALAPGGGCAGHGIPGMRERAQQLGGTLHAGVSASGGFRVAAELPVPVSA